MKVSSLPAYAICLQRKPPLSQAVRSWTSVFPNLSIATAIDGNNLVPETDARLHPLGLMHMNNPDHSGETVYALPSKGAFACALSHYAVCRIAARSAKGVVVIEQDVEISPEGQKYLRQLRLPTDAHFVSLMYIQQNDVTSHCGTFDRLIGPRSDGNQMYFISPDGARNTLAQVFPVAAQCDLMFGVLANNNPRRFRAYALRKRLYSMWQVFRDNSRSTIQNFRVKKYLPRENYFYYGVGCVLVLLLIYMVCTL